MGDENSFEIWEDRVCDKRAVMHGCATRFIVWRKNSLNMWRMVGATWNRADAEKLATA